MLVWPQRDKDEEMTLDIRLYYVVSCSYIFFFYKQFLQELSETGKQLLSFRFLAEANRL